MKKTILGLAVALPFAAAGTLGFASEAKAQVFTDGDVINVFTSACLAVSNDPTVDPMVYFLPPVGAPTFLCGNAAPAADIDLLAELDVAGGFGINTGGFAICNTGGLVSTFCDPGNIRSFIADDDTTQASINNALGTNYFIRVDNADGTFFQFSLDTDTLDGSPAGSEIITLDPATCPGDVFALSCEFNVDLSATGKVAFFAAGSTPGVDDPLDWANVTYAYSGTRFIVDRFDDALGKFVSTPISNSSNIIATIEDANPVPESSAVNALLALGAFGFMASAVKKARK